MKGRQPEIGDRASYWLVMPQGTELREPQRITEIKRSEGATAHVTHVKLADSPCWLKVSDLEHIYKAKR